MQLESPESAASLREVGEDVARALDGLGIAAHGKQDGVEVRDTDLFEGFEAPQHLLLIPDERGIRGAFGPFPLQYAPIGWHPRAQSQKLLCCVARSGMLRHDDGQPDDHARPRPARRAGSRIDARQRELADEVRTAEPERDSICRAARQLEHLRPQCGQQHAM